MRNVQMGAIYITTRAGPASGLARVGAFTSAIWDRLDLHVIIKITKRVKFVFHAA